jgi:hypothetical protein
VSRFQKTAASAAQPGLISSQKINFLISIIYPATSRLAFLYPKNTKFVLGTQGDFLILNLKRAPHGESSLQVFSDERWEKHLSSPSGS